MRRCAKPLISAPTLGWKSAVLEEFTHQRHAATVIHPRILLSRIHAEWDGRSGSECRVFPEKVIRRSVATLNSAVFDCIHCRERGDNFARGKNLNLKLSPGRRFDAFGDDFGAAEDGVETFGEARCHPPLDRRLDSRLCRSEGANYRCAGSQSRAGARQDFTSLHNLLLWVLSFGVGRFQKTTSFQTIKH